MSKVVCTHKDLIPQVLLPDVDYFSVYRTDGRGGVSTVGTGLIREILRSGLSPSVNVWDFLTFALATNAADLAVGRAPSADGWTRTIDLQVALVDPSPFLALRAELAEALRFLTGDFWRLDFIAGGEAPPRSTAIREYDADCVSLLSGGLDSLIGALDLTALGQRPLFVSQIAKGDSPTQIRYADAVGGANRHIQWNHNVKVVHPTERSTRGRSIVFFAFAALAADALAQQSRSRLTVYVPENGLISLNIPLNAGRVGSLSTKTTHPVFMSRLQGIWDALGIPGILHRPYEYLTKGEMLLECRDQQKLSLLAPTSTSCGRFGYYGYKHCGRCVPCMVRRASFLRAGMPDNSPKGYVFNDLSLSRPATGADDIGAAARAVLRIQTEGAATFSTGQLAFSPPNERRQFEGVVERGFAELGALLCRHGIL